MKKLISTIIIWTILMGVFDISMAAGVIKFKDVTDNAWYKEAVYRLVDIGAVNGYVNEVFKPNDSVAVDQFLKMVVMATGSKIEQGKPYWAQPFIDFSKVSGLVGTSDFDNYKRPVTRGEMARILVKALQGAEYPVDLVPYSKMIVDYDKTDPTFQGYILKAFVTGLMTGNPDKTFKYQNNASRAEAVTMILRLIDKSKRILPANPDVGNTNVETLTDKPKLVDFTGINPDIPKVLYEYDYNKGAVPHVLTDSNGVSRTENRFRSNLTMKKMMIPGVYGDIYIMSELAKKYKELADTVNYKTIDSTYKIALLYYFNNSTVREKSVQTWIDEVKKYSIIEEAKVITDPSLVYADSEGMTRVRVRFQFIYHSPSNKDYLKNMGYELDRWYYRDMEILLVTGMRYLNDTWKHGDIVIKKSINLNGDKLLGVD